MAARYTAAKARPNLLPSSALEPLSSALSCTGKASTRLASSLCWNSAHGLKRASYSCTYVEYVIAMHSVSKEVMLVASAILPINCHSTMP